MNRLDEQKKIYQEKLEKWENFLGLPKIVPEKTDVDFILSIKRKDIDNIETKKIFEYCFILSQYSFFLQQKVNECEAFLKWHSYICKQIDNNDLPRLNYMKREIEIRLARINYMSRRIELIVQSLTNIARQRNKGE